MTVQSRSEPIAAVQGPSIHVVRARKLLLAGAVGGLAAAIISIVVMTGVYGRSGLVSALLASAMVLFFYGVGQALMVQFADAGARTLLIVSMMSYTGRIAVLGFVLLFYQRNAERWATLTPLAIFITTMVVVAGWLVVEVFVFSRLRISAYDTEYAAPSSTGSEQ
ncbi:MAG TPA: hypothetical protein VIT20_07485 [Propionibacteriaceae bacterium]